MDLMRRKPFISHSRTFKVNFDIEDKVSKALQSQKEISNDLLTLEWHNMGEEK